MATLSDIRGSYRLTVQSGAVTTIAAATSSAGHIFSMQYVNAASNYTPAMRLRAFEVEFLTTTAFTSAQEVGFDLILARSFSVAPTGATQVTLSGNDQKRYTGHPASDFTAGGDIRVANTSAMTVGTLTLDSKPVVQGSFWSSAQGGQLTTRRYDFSSIANASLHPHGILLKHQEGFVVRNTVLMGAAGVGKWTFTVEWDEVTVLTS